MRSNILICLLALTLAVVTHRVFEIERMVIENEAIASIASEEGRNARRLNWHYAEIVHLKQQMKKGK
jgi:hypothetical protein